MHALLGKSHELQTYKLIFSLLLPSPYHPVCSILLSSHFNPILTFIIICFILSLIFSGLMILHILVQKGQSYHSIHSIIWHWFGDLSLRGCLMGWGSCIHQWFKRVWSFLISFLLEFDLLMIRACKKEKEKKLNDMFVYGILLHWALISPFEVYLLGIFVVVGSCEIFIRVFTPRATLFMHLECRGFIWEFYEILYFLDHGWYVLGMRDEWHFTRVSESLSYPLFHHWWYDFPLLYWYGLIIIHFTFSLPYFVSHHLFLDLRSTFYPFPTYWYTFFIWYLLHIIHMFHW